VIHSLFVYISAVIREISKMPCENYLSGIKKQKMKQVYGSCQKLALQI
jgi:hypothetical protein